MSSFDSHLIRLGSGERRVALVLPTTDAALSAVEKARHRLHVQFVGSLSGMQTPADFLASLASVDQPQSVVVFSDQILSPADTPVLVRSEGSAAFHSTFEFLLVARHGYRLIVWNGEGESQCPEGDTLSNVLGVLHRHLVACEQLGDDWLMRRRQLERTQEWRIRAGARVIRSFESAVCHEYCTDPTHPDASRFLDRTRQLGNAMRRGFAS
ncbi:hypothetical protein GCM10028862_04690 [Luteimonas pelagia]